MAVRAATRLHGGERSGGLRSRPRGASSGRFCPLHRRPVVVEGGAPPPTTPRASPADPLSTVVGSGAHSVSRLREASHGGPGLAAGGLSRFSAPGHAAEEASEILSPVRAGPRNRGPDDALQIPLALLSPLRTWSSGALSELQAAAKRSDSPVAPSPVALSPVRPVSASSPSEPPSPSRLSSLVDSRAVAPEASSPLSTAERARGGESPLRQPLAHGSFLVAGQDLRAEDASIQVAGYTSRLLLPGRASRPDFCDGYL